MSFVGVGVGVPDDWFIDPVSRGLVGHGEGEVLGWQSEALCAETDPAAFFPDKGGSTREAKRVCGACLVRVECLEYSLVNDERFGIWGGLSERERRALRRGRVVGGVTAA